MRNCLRTHQLILLFLLATGVAFAGEFKVSPTSVTFAPGEQTSIVKLTNLSEEDVTVQVELKEWIETENAEDQYLPSKEIIFFPKIVTIPKSSPAFIRVGYQDEHGLQEKTYRMFINELPISKPGVTELKVALSLALPIFVEPEKSNKVWNLVSAEIGEGVVQVDVQNTGNVHIHNEKLHLEGFDDNGESVYSDDMVGWYTLSGKTRTYAMDFPKDLCLQSKEISLDVFVGRNKKSLSLLVDSSLCVDKPQAERIKKKQTEK